MQCRASYDTLIQYTHMSDLRSLAMMIQPLLEFKELGGR